MLIFDNCWIKKEFFCEIFKLPAVEQLKMLLPGIYGVSDCSQIFCNHIQKKNKTEAKIVIDSKELRKIVDVFRCPKNFKIDNNVTNKIPLDIMCRLINAAKRSATRQIKKETIITLIPVQKGTDETPNNNNNNNNNN